MPGLADLPAPEAIRAGGETLLARRLGEGAPMVLLHGGPGLDHHLLVPLAHGLARGREIWLPDLPGHGRQGCPPVSLRQTLERLARWLRGLDAPIVGGHSLGAWLARELIRERAISPRAAVLLCPPGPLRGKEARRAALSMHAADEAALRDDLLKELEARGPVDPLLREAIDNAALRSPARYPRLEMDLAPLLRAAVPPLASYRPVLVLAGALDEVAPPSAAKAVAAATRGAALKVLAGVGHVPWSSSPRRTVEEIQQFLEQHGL